MVWWALAPRVAGPVASVLVNLLLYAVLIVGVLWLLAELGVLGPILGDMFREFIWSVEPGTGVVRP